MACGINRGLLRCTEPMQVDVADGKRITGATVACW